MLVCNIVCNYFSDAVVSCAKFSPTHNGGLGGKETFAVVCAKVCCAGRSGLSNSVILRETHTAIEYCSMQSMRTYICN